jgi:DNA-directed RNA polymerase subunit RPC12/RpoP
MVSKEEAILLCHRYRLNRAGIRNSLQMVSVCLICGSIHMVSVEGSAPPAIKCQNCGFEFIRYTCWSCGSTVDGRDSDNPACRECGWRVCTCSACSSAECNGHRQRVNEVKGPG